ncbi:MAG: Lrp/AsnC family transcriptional regulator, partial [Candidatus Thiodiazotropha endolucinida]
MLQSGVIRRLGLVPNHYRLGFKGNGMTVWNIPDDQLREAGERIGAMDFVSHCYA